MKKAGQTALFLLNFKFKKNDLFFIFQNFDFLRCFWYKHWFWVFMPREKSKLKLLKNKKIF